MIFNFIVIKQTALLKTGVLNRTVLQEYESYEALFMKFQDEKQQICPVLLF